jgi:hypothetical protein
MFAWFSAQADGELFERLAITGRMLVYFDQRQRGWSEGPAYVDTHYHHNGRTALSASVLAISA